MIRHYRFGKSVLIFTMVLALIPFSIPNVAWAADDQSQGTQNSDKEALLASGQAFAEKMSLKKAVTVDKSAPVLSTSQNSGGGGGGGDMMAEMMKKKAEMEAKTEKGEESKDGDSEQAVAADGLEGGLDGMTSGNDDEAGFGVSENLDQVNPSFSSEDRNTEDGINSPMQLENNMNPDGAMPNPEAGKDALGNALGLDNQPHAVTEIATVAPPLMTGTIDRPDLGFGADQNLSNPGTETPEDFATDAETQEPAADAPAAETAEPSAEAAYAMREVSLDGCMFTQAQAAEQQTALDAVFENFGTAGQETGGNQSQLISGQAGIIGANSSANMQMTVMQRFNAVAQTAQEAAMLASGAPAASNAGNSGNDMLSSFNFFSQAVTTGMQASLEGLNLSPEAVTQFEKIQENFNQMATAMAEQVGNMMSRTEGSLGQPGGPGEPFGSAPRIMTEGGSMPMPVISFSDMGMAFGAAMTGMNPSTFTEGMTRMMEARTDFIANHDPAAPGEGFRGPNQEGGFKGPEGMPAAFAAMFNPSSGEGNNAAFNPAMAALFGPDAANTNPAATAENFVQAFAAAPIFANDIAQQISQQINADRTIIEAQRITQTFLQDPTAQNVFNALNNNFTAADRTFLENNPGQTIARAFIEEVSATPTRVGPEEIHVTYSLHAGHTNTNGDFGPNTQHVDANTTIHNQVHNETVVTEHIPGIA